MLLTTLGDTLDIAESRELLSDIENEISYNSDIDEFVVGESTERTQEGSPADAWEEERSDTEARAT
jgi:hypothetical protein